MTLWEAIGFVLPLGGIGFSLWYRSGYEAALWLIILILVVSYRVDERTIKLQHQVIQRLQDARPHVDPAEDQRA